MDDDSTRSVLRRIAAALDICESTFWTQDGGRPDARFAAVSEQLELLTVFQAIGDPEVRGSCLQYLRDAARSTAPAMGAR
ncbi:hypothetical protein [Methylobacterium sp. J-068]|uniref:hypothetical protein n=1 Tax=Methylobacterium sp. J-068 TaxID=2836649 RepID=UPI001FBB425C|nr:hypothetical protein [Methylobacterium sp. J-068]MCJ2037013.1 hypothetical protein [Methylobacterium sp. J-068]